MQIAQANLKHTCFVDNCFEGTLFEHVSFLKTKFADCNFTGVQFSGTHAVECIVKRIKCDYALIGDSQPVHTEFLKGQFESRLKSSPSFDYVFKEGMGAFDPQIMHRVATEIQKKNPEFSIKISGVETMGKTASIRFSIKDKSNVEKAKRMVRRKYKKQIEELNRDKNSLERLLKEAMLSQKNITNNYFHMEFAPKTQQLVADGLNSTIINESDPERVSLVQGRVELNHSQDLINICNMVDGADVPEKNKSVLRSKIEEYLDEGGKTLSQEGAKSLLEVLGKFAPVIAQSAGPILSQYLR